MMRNRVTADTVKAVKRMLSDPRYTLIGDDEIAKLCDTSATSVSRIRQGKYDHLLSEVAGVPMADTDDAIVHELLEIKALLTSIVCLLQTESDDK